MGNCNRVKNKKAVIQTHFDCNHPSTNNQTEDNNYSQYVLTPYRHYIDKHHFISSNDPHRQIQYHNVRDSLILKRIEESTILLRRLPITHQL